MADPTLTEDAATASHGVVRRPTRLFVHHHQAGPSPPACTHAGGSAESVSGSSCTMRRSASSTRSARQHRRISHEGQLRRALHMHLRRSRCGAAVWGGVRPRRWRRPRPEVETIDHGRAQIGRCVDRGDGEETRPLVGIGQAFDVFGHHLAQHLIHPQRTRSTGLSAARELWPPCGGRKTLTTRRHVTTQVLGISSFLERLDHVAALQVLEVQSARCRTRSRPGLRGHRP